MERRYVRETRNVAWGNHTMVADSSNLFGGPKAHQKAISIGKLV